MAQSIILRKRMTYIAGGGGTPTESWVTSDTADVGSGAGRLAIVEVIYLNNGAHPSTCHVGTGGSRDTLTAVGAEYSDGSSYRRRIFVGELSAASGAVTLEGLHNTDSSLGGGTSVAVLVVQDSAAPTFGGLSSYSNNAAGSGTFAASVAVSSGSGAVVYFFGSDINSGTASVVANNGSTLAAGSVCSLAVSSKAWSTGATTTVGIDYDGDRNFSYFGFALTGAGGGGSSIAAISNYHRMMRAA